jgi:hypothetical protein
MTSTNYGPYRFSTIAHGNHKSLNSTCPLQVQRTDNEC